MRLHRSIRRLTDPVFTRIPVPIVAGVNRGRLWNLASAGSGYASGRRALSQMRLLNALLRPGDVVWDVGAHHGYVTLLAGRKVGAVGCVHAFEPDGMNARILTRHVRWNQLGNTSVHAVALGAFDGEVSFGGGPTSKMHAVGQGLERVPIRRADVMVRTGVLRAPNFVKVDVEGGEGDMLEGAIHAIPPHACLLIAMHSPTADAQCSRMLEARGFTLVPSRALQFARTHMWHSDPDLFCIGPARRDGAAVQAVLHSHAF